MFKYSIIHDIVKVDAHKLILISFTMFSSQGIIYIHNSDLQSHGNLKSTNCLVGSRVSLLICKCSTKAYIIEWFSLLLKYQIMVFHLCVVQLIKNIRQIMTNIINVILSDFFKYKKTIDFFSL